MRRRPLALALAVGALLVTSTVALGAPAEHSQAWRSQDHRVVEKAVWIQAGDHQVPGTFAYPKNGGSKTQFPAVLMLHGFGSSSDEVGNMYLNEARALALRGYASLRIDFAGSGVNPQPFVENTYDGMMADSTAALDWLIAQKNTRDSRVGILGFSLGGKLAVDLAGTDTRIKALATWSGANENGFGSLTYLADDYRAEANANGHVVIDLGWRTVDLSKAWFDTMEASRSLDHLAAYTGPQLAVAGEIDTTVNPQVSRDSIAKSGSMDATLRIIPGADHIYLVLTPDQTLANLVINLTAKWFAAKL
jgi:dienelactone hydrolase